MAGQPVVENGALVTLTRPSSPTLNVPFSMGIAKVTIGGFPVIVTTGCLLGGSPFVASLFTSKLLITVSQIPVVLVGATVTRPDGYTGVIPPTCGAGVKYTVD